jgi:hypothetical protein
VETWWLSFADPDLQPGMQFLGVLIVDMPDGSDVNLAAIRAHEMGLNPGGEVAGCIVDGSRFAPEHRKRLLLRAEAEALATIV